MGPSKLAGFFRTFHTANGFSPGRKQGWQFHTGLCALYPCEQVGNLVEGGYAQAIALAIVVLLVR
jgi:hypothetical protein